MHLHSDTVSTQQNKVSLRFGSPPFPKKITMCKHGCHILHPRAFIPASLVIKQIKSRGFAVTVWCNDCSGLWAVGQIKHFKPALENYWKHSKMWSRWNNDLASFLLNAQLKTPKKHAAFVRAFCPHFSGEVFFTHQNSHVDEWASVISML